jgi:hypothetical protein
VVVSCVHVNEPSAFMKGGEFLDCLLMKDSVLLSWLARRA